MTILRIVLTIIFAPVFLVLRLAILFCIFLTAVSSGLLSIAATLLGTMAVLVICTVSTESGIALFVIAWLIGPVGLPLLAEKLLYMLDDLCSGLQRRIAEI